MDGSCCSPPQAWQPWKPLCLTVCDCHQDKSSFRLGPRRRKDLYPRSFNLFLFEQNFWRWYLAVHQYDYLTCRRVDHALWTFWNVALAETFSEVQNNTTIVVSCVLGHTQWRKWIRRSLFSYAVPMVMLEFNENEFYFVYTKNTGSNHSQQDLSHGWPCTPPTRVHAGEMWQLLLKESAASVSLNVDSTSERIWCVKSSCWDLCFGGLRSSRLVLLGQHSQIDDSLAACGLVTEILLDSTRIGGVPSSRKNYRLFFFKKKPRHFQIVLQFLFPFVILLAAE